MGEAARILESNPDIWSRANTIVDRDKEVETLVQKNKGDYTKLGKMVSSLYNKKKEAKLVKNSAEGIKDT